MASQGKIIKNKISSVKNIRKITKTMEMVSVAKMRKSVEKTLKSRTFTQEVYEMLSAISKRYEVQGHHLFNTPESEKDLVCIIASNKGMCGGYNTNVSKEFRKYVSSISDIQNIELITVGKQAEKIAGRYDFPVIASFTKFSENLSLDEALGLSKVIMNEFQSKKYKSIKIISTDFIRSTQYETKTTQILPISMNLSGEYADNKIEEVPEIKEYLIEPNINLLLTQIVPKLINAIIYQLLLDALASEHSARMIAMKNATDSAGELISSLTLSFNQIRQAGITQELSEIIAGASALHA